MESSGNPNTVILERQSAGGKRVLVDPVEADEGDHARGLLENCLTTVLTEEERYSLIF